MYPQVFLVLSLFLNTALPSPFYNSPRNNGEVKSTTALSSLSLSENQQKLNDIAKESTTTAADTTETEKPNDLTGQETFYPIGGIWWGVRPWGGWGSWGGWGGYRPWYGWRGPQWGGHWGGSWGGRWGRTSS